MTPRFWEHPLLAIESSCDETSAAVVHGHRVLSNVVASQADMHRKYGGVVPEVASRAHVEAFIPVISEAIQTARIDRKDLGAIAVTNRPGLVGALSVGLTGAKALARHMAVPCVGIHHLEGHLCSPFAEHPDLPYPHLSLIVSGGHTELVMVHGPGQHEILGETRDDAAGEAFDKGARLLGLGYPGGLRIQEAASGGNPKRYPLPRALAKDARDFSFSGLKTAMLRLVQGEGDALNTADAAASLQEAIVDALNRRVELLLDELRPPAFTLVGGVAANLALRTRLAATCARLRVPMAVPRFDLCTDNAAMIGLAASIRLAHGIAEEARDVSPNAELPRG